MEALTGSPTRSSGGGVGRDSPPQKRQRRQKLQARKAQRREHVNVTHAIILGKAGEEPQGLTELVHEEVALLCFRSGDPEQLDFLVDRGVKLEKILQLRR